MKQSKLLTAMELKEILWDTLLKLKSNNIEVKVSDGIANQAREILRTTKIQLAILGQANKAVPRELLDFAEGISVYDV